MPVHRKKPIQSTESQTRRLLRRRVVRLTFACSLVLGLIASGVVAAVLAYNGSLPGYHKFSIRTCHSSDCLYVAEMIRSAVNASVDPCHDFYEYVCGSYAEAHTVDRLIAVSIRTNSIFRALLSASLANRTAPPASSAGRKANALYRSCLDVVAKKQNDMPVLTNFLGSHGLDLSSLDTKESALEVIFQLYFQYGITAVFAFNLAEFITRDFKRELLFRIDKNLLVWYKYRAALIKMESIGYFMTTFLRQYGDKVRAIAQAVYDVENKAHVAMAQVSTRFATNASDFYSVQISNIGTFTPNTVTREEWTRLMLKYAGTLYTADDRILVEKRAVTYLQALYATIGASGLKLLVAWTVLRTYAGYVDESVASFLYGDYERECQTRVDRLMPVAFHAQQLFAVAPPETARAAHEIASNVREGAKTIFADSVWLDNTARAVALSKLSGILFHVGYPDGQDSQAALDAYYGDLAYPSDRPFLNAWLNASRHYLRKLVDKNTGFLFVVNEVNAFYSTGANQVVVPAALLQRPIYFRDAVASFNYGSLGHVIGHEIMHAYDVRGINIDEKGFAVSWMLPSSLERYKDNARCVRKEHESVLAWRSMVLVDNLDSENIADFAGARAAYEAFRSLPGEVRFARVPGPFYPEQLFFIGYCLKWCESHFHPRSREGRYSPGFGRCVVPLRNMREFADAFHCARNTRMNPESKCSFW
ncbi:membrane metallo-endopeptidase-like 1 [Rhipicephalus sanguineus]|uniref:membrane metallo-endopeptidase-like 1 n=1 Tax=Rhipicephalus sanguineus TaxID=34632 RepID=UPI001893E66A|nr:membrane metallo-endopeptidase-like 1 [Rhipicephalus sanguineus]